MGCDASADFVPIANVVSRKYFVDNILCKGTWWSIDKIGDGKSKDTGQRAGGYF